MNATSPIAAFADRKPHRITVEMLLAMTDADAFAKTSGRVELLEGVLYEMSPQTSRHFLAKNRLTFRLQSWIVEQGLTLEALSEPTVQVDHISAPEPDIVIWDMSGGTGFCPASSVKLAVEIALSSLNDDLEYKRLLYARAGIPEYWVVDVEGAQVHRFWSIADSDYRERAIFALGGDLESATIAGLKIDTAGIC